MSEQTNMVDAQRRSRVCALVDLARQQAGDSGLRLGRDTSPGAIGDPRVFPGYEITAEIYRGGQGVVYQARQSSTGRTVAIKVMREGPFAGEAGRLRFEREVSILAQLDHRNIIGILERGTAAGSQYLVMDYVDGRPLDRYARELGLPLKERLLLFAEVCDAVNAAHLRGVIHRDLKPSNILVDSAGEPRILDFGLAKMADVEEIGATQTGQFVGSLPWVSPEQARGLLAEVDIRSDAYSLGVVLYQLLTDRFPYSTVGDLERVLSNIRSADPIRPATFSSEVDDELETIVLKSLAKDPARRYQSVGELARDVRHYLAAEPIEAKRDSTAYLVRKTLQRHRTAFAASGAFVLLLALATLLSIGLWRRAATQRDEAIAAGQREAIARRRADAEALKATQSARYAQEMLSGIDPATAGNMDKRLMRLVLEGSAKRVDLQLGDQPEIQAAVRYTLGKTYRAIGDFAAAQTQLEKSVDLRRQLLGQANADTLTSMDELAMLYMDQGEYSKAEKLCTAVLDGRRHLLGETHRDTLLSLANLSEILESQGRFPEAETLDREVLEKRTKSLGPDDPETLTSMNNLAGILRVVQRFEEAEPLYRKAIEIEKRVEGPLHPHTLATMSNLALLCQESGRLDESEKRNREVLDLRRQVFGEDHPAVINTLANLADVLRAKGDLEQAEIMFRRLTEVDRRVLGEKHPTLAVHLFSLSSLIGKKGDYLQAEKLLRESVAINEASLPPDHWQTLTSKIGLGACLVRLGRFEEAEPILIAGQAAIQGKPEVPEHWQVSAVTYLVRLYEGWDAKSPNTGKAEKAAQWRARLPATSSPATTNKS